MPSVISIHVPKSAGTSLLKLFQVAFGSENVLADYEDRPGNPISQMYLDPVRWEKSRPKSLPAGVSVVHGHFHPCKYDHISDAFRMTFLRHPVCNLISTYLYWKAIPPQPNPLHRYFLDNNLGVFELAQIPLLRYLLSKTYFGGWDMAKLDFIGRHETRKDDLKCLEPLLGVPLDADVHLNATETEEVGSQRRSLLGDRRLVARLTDLLAEDISFYDRYAN